MQTHKINFKFVGGSAEEGSLDGSDVTAYTVAARQLMALHAFFYTTGSVPNGGALNQTRLYHVRKRPAVLGSYDDQWLIDIAKDAVHALTRDLTQRPADYTFERFFKDSVDGILTRRAPAVPPEVRDEPVLPAVDRGNEPVFDFSAEREHRWQQLRERGTGMLIDASRPVGRSAAALIIHSEELRVAEIDTPVLRMLVKAHQKMREVRASRELAIEQAVEQLKFKEASRFS